MDEHWGTCPLIGPDYEVSDHGNIRRCRPGRGVKRLGQNRAQSTIRTGHKQVTIRKKRYMMHHLVLETFVGPRPEGLVACHNDGNPANNHVSNLRWDTLASNTQDMLNHGTAWPARITHCKNGHELTGSNVTYRSQPNGRPRRDCRRCNIDRATRWNSANPERRQATTKRYRETKRAA